MSTFPSQTLDLPDGWNLEADIQQAELTTKEARWWALEPGEEGYGVPLHEYLGFTDAQWRDYAISQRRTR